MALRYCPQCEGGLMSSVIHKDYNDYYKCGKCGHEQPIPEFDPYEDPTYYE